MHWIARRTVWPRLLALLIIAALYLAWPDARPDLLALNADDSEAYLTLSQALTHGLGYTRSLDAGRYVPHTTWPPGMPVLLAPVAALGLPLNYLVLKLFLIALGLLGIVLAWLYVKRLTTSAITADIAALLLAFAPFYWLYSRVAMSEMPAVLTVLAALLLLDHIWARRRPGLWQVGLAGLACGCAMLLRGTLLGLALVPLAYWRGARAATLTPRAWLGRAVLHGACFCLPTLAWSLRNRLIDTAGLGFDGINQMRMLLALSPLDPASPLATPAQIARRAAEALAYHVVYALPDQMLPWLADPTGARWPDALPLALILSLALLLAAFPRRAAGLGLGLTLAPAMALLCLVGSGGAPRYWVPITALMLLLIAINAAPRLERLRPAGRAILLALLIAADAPALAAFAISFDRAPYLDDLADLVTLFDDTAQLTPPPAALLTPHWQTYRLRTGLPAPMSLPGRATAPLYSHIIVRGAPPIAGAVDLLQRGAWHLYALPHPMGQDQLAH